MEKKWKYQIFALIFVFTLLLCAFGPSEGLASDVYVYDIEEPSTLDAYEDFKVTAVLMNDGDDDETIYYEYFLDNQKKGGDYALIIPSAGWRKSYITVKIEEGPPPGDHEIKFCIGRNCSIDSKTEKWTWTGGQNYPDLELSKIYDPPLESAKAFQVKVKIKNIGDTNSGRFTLSMNVYGDINPRYRSWTLDDLEAGDYTYHTADVSALPNGYHCIKFTIDTHDFIVEKDENNNEKKFCGTWNWDPDQLPDLTVSDIIISKPVLEGEEFKVTPVISNNGNINSDPCTLKIIIDNSVTYNYPIGEIRPGVTSEYPLTFSNGLEAGQHSIEFIIDSDSQVLESNESNNKLATTFDSSALITIQETGWDLEVDNDNDGYKSQTRLTWKYGLNTDDSINTYIKVFYKKSNTEQWTEYLEGVVSSVNPSNSHLTNSLDIGTDDTQFDHFEYDWKLEIYLEGETTPVDFRDPSNDDNLDNYKMEMAEEDGRRLAVIDAWWEDEIDKDGDGYKTQASLVYQIDTVTNDGSITGYEKIFYEIEGSNEWVLLGTTTSRTLWSDRNYTIPINSMPELNKYDWRIVGYTISDTGVATQYGILDDSNDAQLDNYWMEPETTDEPGGGQHWADVDYEGEVYGVYLCTTNDHVLSGMLLPEDKNKIKSFYVKKGDTIINDDTLSRDILLTAQAYYRLITEINPNDSWSNGIPSGMFRKITIYNEWSDDEAKCTGFEPDILPPIGRWDNVLWTIKPNFHMITGLDNYDHRIQTFKDVFIEDFVRSLAPENCRDDAVKILFEFEKYFRQKNFDEIADAFKRFMEIFDLSKPALENLLFDQTVYDALGRAIPYFPEMVDEISTVKYTPGEVKARFLNPEKLTKFCTIIEILSIWGNFSKELAQQQLLQVLALHGDGPKRVDAWRKTLEQYRWVKKWDPAIWSGFKEAEETFKQYLSKDLDLRKMALDEYGEQLVEDGVYAILGYISASIGCLPCDVLLIAIDIWQTWHGPEQGKKAQQASCAVSLQNYLFQEGIFKDQVEQILDGNVIREKKLNSVLSLYNSILYISYLGLQNVCYYYAEISEMPTNINIYNTVIASAFPPDYWPIEDSPKEYCIEAYANITELQESLNIDDFALSVKDGGIGDENGWLKYLGYGQCNLTINIDQDNDRIPDSWELYYGIDATASSDSDSDGLKDIDEYRYGTNPTLSDSDGDRMPDGYEINNGFDPNNGYDGSLDNDNDGLSNTNEWLNQTSPDDSDSDNDGMPDGWEVKYGLNPLSKNDADNDNDGDGLTNLTEYQHNTNPLIKDTDQDGSDDNIEIASGTDPLNPNDNPATNEPPVLNLPNDIEVSSGDAITLNIKATDPNGGTPEITASNLPSDAIFMDMQDGTARLLWTPTSSDEGKTFSVEITASDGELKDTGIIKINVTQGGVSNHPPVWQSCLSQTANVIYVEEIFAFTLIATDPDGDALTLTMASTLPGANFTDNGDGTGLFSWRPMDSQVGSHSVEFIAVDEQSNEVSLLCEISVLKKDEACHILPSYEYTKAVDLTDKLDLHSYSRAVAVEDVNGDGSNEIIVVYENYLTVFNADGTVMAENRHRKDLGAATLIVEDINADGQKEIIVSAGNSEYNGVPEGRVIIFLNSGPIFWETEFQNDNVWDQMDVGDLDGDGRKEVVIGYHTGDSRSRDAHVVAYTVSGNTMAQRWKYTIDISAYDAGETTDAWSDVHCLAVGDLNQDEKDEVIVSIYGDDDDRDSLDYTIQLNGNGKRVAAVKAGHERDANVIKIADLNNDGNNEIVLGRYERIEVRKDGLEEIGIWDQNGLDGQISDVCVGDLDNDNELEVIGVNDGVVFAMEKDGTPKWTYDTGVNDELSVASADLDYDGQWEVIVGADDRNGSVFILTGDGNLKQQWNNGNDILAILVEDIQDDCHFEIIAREYDLTVWEMKPTGVKIDPWLSGWLESAPSMLDPSVSDTISVSDTGTDIFAYIPLQISDDGSTYHVYAALKDKDGNVLVSNSQGNWFLWVTDAYVTGSEFTANGQESGAYFAFTVPTESGAYDLVLEVRDVNDRVLDSVSLPMNIVPENTAELNITVSPTGSGTVTKAPDQATYSIGETIRLEAIPSDGFTFGNWSGDLSGNESVVEITINANMTITANFTPDSQGPPVWDSCAASSVNAGDKLEFTVKAADPDSDSMTLSMASNITGATFVDNSDGTGLFTWIPAESQVGTYQVEFIAKDEHSAKASLTCEIEVLAPLLPVIAIDLQSHDFGDVLSGESAEKIFTISNQGDADLTVSGSVITGDHPDQFAITNGANSFVLAPGATQTMTVQFAPSSVGIKNASLQINSDDPDENPLIVSLSGNGTDNQDNGIRFGCFGVTELTYEPTADWDQVVQDVFGAEYRVADWNDLVKYYNDGGDMLALFDGLGLTEYLLGKAFVTRNGQRIYSGDRYYFAQRHEHNKPDNFLAHENIDNYLISLGSWWNPKKIMVFRTDGCEQKSAGWPHANFNFQRNRYNSASSLKPVTGDQLTEQLVTEGSGRLLSADLTGDERLETVIIELNRVLVYDSEGVLLWSEDLSSPTTAFKGTFADLSDIDGDGLAEMAVNNYLGNNSYEVIFFDGDGRRIKSIPIWGSNNETRIIPQGTLDLNGDGKLEFVVTVMTGYQLWPRAVQVYDYETGQLNWKFDTANQASAAAIGDTDGDGLPELYVTGFAPHNGAAANGMTDSYAYVTALTHDGVNLWNRQLGNANDYVTLVDIDSDDVPEILVKSRQYASYPGIPELHILNSADGKTIASTQTNYNMSFTNVVGADVLGDAKTEIIAASEDGLVRIYDQSLTLIASKTFGNGAARAYVLVNDINGDGRNDLVVWAGSEVFVTDGEFNPIWQYQTPTEINDLIVTDVNLDGCNDIIVSADRTYTLSACQNKAAVTQWPHANCNMRRNAFNPSPALNPVSDGALIERFVSDGSGKVFSADLIGDEQPETVVAELNRILVYDATGALLWSQNLASPSPTFRGTFVDLSDADGDGLAEIAVNNYLGGTSYEVIFFDGDGSRIKSIPIEASNNETQIVPQGTLDINGDGKLEFVVTIRTGYLLTPRGVRVYDYETGQLNWKYDTANLLGDVAFGDTNGDGLPELYVGGFAPHNGAYANGMTDFYSYVTALDHSGTNLWNRILGNARCAVVMADLDNDGRQEILVSRKRYESYPGIPELHILNAADGSTIASVQGNYNMNFNSVVVADIRGDDAPEIITASADGLLRIYDNALSLILSESISDESAFVIVNDINGDGRNELVVWSDTQLMVMDGELNVLWQYHSSSAIKDLIVSDTDADGSNDIIFSADQTSVLEFDTVPSVKGDVNGDGVTDLQDAIIVLKVVSGQDVTGLIRVGYAASGADVNGDNRVGMPELLFILEWIAGQTD